MSDVYDFSFDPPTPDALVAVGAVGVIGYLASDPAKTITRAQVDAFHAAGLAVGFVHEETADWRTWNGTLANQIADQLGVPDDVTIFYAADSDVAPADFGNVHRALLAQPSTRPRGIYGGKGLCCACLDGGSAVHGWGTAATSWDHGDCDRLVLQQTTDSTVPGTDRNEVLQPLWGAWTLSQPTTEEEPMIMIRRASDGYVALVAGNQLVHVVDPADEWAFGAAGVKLADGLSDAQFDAFTARFGPLPG